MQNNSSPITMPYRPILLLMLALGALSLAGAGTALVPQQGVAATSGA